MNMLADQYPPAEAIECLDCRYEAHKAQEADKLAAAELERQYQASKDATVQRRNFLKMRLREAISEMQAMTREPMPLAQYNRVCVSIVTLMTAHDELEVMI